MEQIEAAAKPEALIPNPVLLFFPEVYDMTRDALFSRPPPKPIPAIKRAMVRVIILSEIIVRNVPRA